MAKGSCSGKGCSSCRVTKGAIKRVPLEGKGK